MRSTKWNATKWNTTVIAMCVAGAAAIGMLAQAPPAGQATGPGVQSASDAKEPDVLKTCKVPPPARGGRAGGAGRGQGRGAAPPTAPIDDTVKEIPGVIAAGQKWKEVWQVSGNNADGIIGTKDGGLLIAQNDKSSVVKLDKKGKVTVAYSGLNTSGAVSMNAKGVLFVNNRGLNSSIEKLAPRHEPFANKINGGDPFDCAGTVLNDLSAAKSGAVYFTMGQLYFANPQGVVTKQSENLNTNGIILSADEKTLYVTNGATIVAFDVQPDGSLKNQRDFAKLEAGGGGDGSTIDSEGRLYVTAQANGIQVFSKEGKYLGVIPAPRALISVAFSGPGKKTLYAVSRDTPKNEDWIIAIPMISQGFKGRAK
jgi:gluconolactonase